MNNENVKCKLVNIVSQLFRGCDFDITMVEYADLIDDLGMDSLTFISFIVEIEATFSITIPDDFLIMDNYRNIENVQTIVEHQLLNKEQKIR